jgi:hypothetical protein
LATVTVIGHGAILVAADVEETKDHVPVSTPA